MSSIFPGAEGAIVDYSFQQLLPGESPQTITGRYVEAQLDPTRYEHITEQYLAADIDHYTVPRYTQDRLATGIGTLLTEKLVHPDFLLLASGGIEAEIELVELLGPHVSRQFHMPVVTDVLLKLMGKEKDISQIEADKLVFATLIHDLGVIAVHGGEGPQASEEANPSLRALEKRLLKEVLFEIYPEINDDIDDIADIVYPELTIPKVERGALADYFETAEAMAQYQTALNIFALYTYDRLSTAITPRYLLSAQSSLTREAELLEQVRHRYGHVQKLLYETHDMATALLNEPIPQTPGSDEAG
jgi:hypothetical protein